MKLQHLLTAALLMPLTVVAQDRYASRSGHISFHSSTPVEDIDAHNYKATSVIDPASGAVQIAALMKGFEFKKALMQEHFNENYVESDKFPKAEFKGTISGLQAGDLSKPGTYEVTVDGDLSLHGVTKKVSEKGTIVVDPTGAVKASTTFLVKPEDYGIKIPGTVRANIAEEIQVKVQIDHQKM